MLTEVADGVLVRQSEFCLSNAIVIVGDQGVLLVDPGVYGADLNELADDLRARALTVSAGVSTHPHWDHLLWHRAFGDGPRWASAAGAAAAQTSVADARTKAAQLAPGVDSDLIGDVTALPGADRISWDGPDVRVVEHSAHAPGHIGLQVGAVFIVGDMLSDVEIPLLNPKGGDPLADYMQGLELLAQTAQAGVEVMVPGHGKPAFGDEIMARFDHDRQYLTALRAGNGFDDVRIAPDATYGSDWLPDAHRRHLDIVRSTREIG